MATQTTYNEEQLAAIAGAPATMIPATDITRSIENAQGIAFGRAVQQGSSQKTVVPFVGGGLVGITLLDRSAEGVEGNPDAFPQYASARIRTKGDIWVTAAVVVDAGDEVYVTSAGAFTNVDTGNTAVPLARWETSTSANGQLAVIRLA